MLSLISEIDHSIFYMSWVGGGPLAGRGKMVDIEGHVMMPRNCTHTACVAGLNK